jgi:hypothetical protein
MDKFKALFDTGEKRMVTALIGIFVNLLFSGYSFGNLGSDMKLLITMNFDAVETTALTEVSKIINDPEDAKKAKFDYVFTYYNIMMQRPDQADRVVTLRPLVLRMEEFYSEKWLN